MESARRGRVTRPAAAAALVLVGLAALGLWRVLSGSEDLPFAQGAAPPATAHVTRDATYSLAVPGGVPAMLAAGVPTADSNGNQVISLQCTWLPGSTDPTAPATDAQSLQVTPESTSTKAEDTVGRFAAPTTGPIHVSCAGWGAMFVPDSDDRQADTSGWAMIVAIIALTAGAGLGLCELRLGWLRSQGSRAAGEDDEIERFVDVAPVGREHREVGDHDRGDVGT